MSQFSSQCEFQKWRRPFGESYQILMGKLRDQWKVGFYKEKGLPTENSSLIVKYSFYIKKVSGPDWQWGYLLEVWETCVPACHDDVFVEPWLRGGIAFRNGVSYGLGDSHLHSRFTGLVLHSKILTPTLVQRGQGHIIFGPVNQSGFLQPRRG